MSLLNVIGDDVMPLTSPMHHLLPSDAGIDIYTKNYDKCVYVNILSPGMAYSVRGREKIAEGISLGLLERTFKSWIGRI